MTETHGKLDGKVALVTGAANGIGRAIVERFSQEGAAVMVADINKEGAIAVAQGIREKGGVAESITCDVGNTDAAKQAVGNTVSRFWPTHHGHRWGRPVVSDRTGSRTFRTGLAARPRCEPYGLFPDQQARHSPSEEIARQHDYSDRIQMARVASAGQSLYCATKGALTQLAKGMALDYAADQIRVNTLSPGGVATGRLATRFGDLETAQHIWGAKHPMGRLGEPDEIARAAVFLASEDSTFMTGADLLIDGGYTAW
ncbi:MAG: glucose-1-dehydrogenase [Gammaproteobacteria bacterium]|nr:MAG: glucose-1-dehydrogenase [Gammaproteobacteria bacterium]